MNRPGAGGSDRDPAHRAQAREQGDYRPSTVGAGDLVDRRGPGGGPLGPLVRDDGSREQPMVPRAEFRSYYGRQILKTPAWEDKIAYYFFAGGLSGGAALLAAGADLTGRPALRRGSRVGGLAALAAGAYFLVADLGRPDRFHHMLLVAKPTSPMSMGTWLLTAYGPALGLAAASELVPKRWQGSVPGRLVRALGRPAGLAAAALAPGVASYGAVLLSQTAVPAWHSGHEELPFIFTASSAASAGGLGMIVAPVSEAAPARRLATYGAVVELAASRRLETRLGLVSEAPCWPAGSSSGSACCMPASSPPRTPSTSSSRSAAASPSTVRPARAERSDLADSPAGPSQNSYRSGRSVGGSAVRHWAARIDTKAVLP